MRAAPRRECGSSARTPRLAAQTATGPRQLASCPLPIGGALQERYHIAPIMEDAHDQSSGGSCACSQQIEIRQDHSDDMVRRRAVLRNSPRAILLIRRNRPVALIWRRAGPDAPNRLKLWSRRRNKSILRRLLFLAERAPRFASAPTAGSIGSAETVDPLGSFPHSYRYLATLPLAAPGLSLPISWT